MSEHGKENGERIGRLELNRVADGYTGQRIGRGRNSSLLSQFIKKRENPSKCYCLVLAL